MELSMSATIIVLFNLRPETSASDYEAWANSTDLPIVRGLSSVDSFDVFKSQSLLGSDKAPPFEYIEVIQVNDMDVFGGETSTDVMGKVAKEFQNLADNPTFIMTGKI